jgi:hypothetical protein
MIHSVEWGGKVVKSCDYVIIGKEVIVAVLKMMSRNSPGETE